jgi:hypothetical protein
VKDKDSTWVVTTERINLAQVQYVRELLTIEVGSVARPYLLRRPPDRVWGARYIPILNHVRIRAIGENQSGYGRE